LCVYYPIGDTDASWHAPIGQIAGELANCINILASDLLEYQRSDGERMPKTAVRFAEWNQADDGPILGLHHPDELKLPLVLNSPHSGRCYPKSFLQSSRLSGYDIRRSEDSFVDQLFEPMVAAGATLQFANFPRAYLDVNREPYELDQRMFQGDLPSYSNRQSQRVACGLGTIARIVAENAEIYRAPMPVDQALHRIENVYKPYHAALRRVLAQVHVAFGFAILVDCHSMPSAGRQLRNQPRPDIILGDRFGTSCASALTDEIYQQFRAKGYSVARNKPYAGGFITHHYGRPLKGLHAVQIEINRNLYMHEEIFEKRECFAEVSDDLCAVLNAVAELNYTVFEGELAAAE
jgi:N-formylglutamate amidohydrolase